MTDNRNQSEPGASPVENYLSQIGDNISVAKQFVSPEIREWLGIIGGILCVAMFVVGPARRTVMRVGRLAAYLPRKLFVSKSSDLLTSYVKLLELADAQLEGTDETGWTVKSGPLVVYLPCVFEGKKLPGWIKLDNTPQDRILTEKEKKAVFSAADKAKQDILKGEHILARHMAQERAETVLTVRNAMSGGGDIQTHDSRLTNMVSSKSPRRCAEDEANITRKLLGLPTVRDKK